MKRADFKAVKFLAEVPNFQGGIFRAIPLSWKLQPPKEGGGSQSVAVAVQYGIVSQWSDTEKGWSPEWPIGWHTIGYHYVIKRDGSANEAGFRMISEAGLWFGDFADFEEGKLPPEVLVHIDVRLSPARDGFAASWKVEWVSPDTDVPRERGGLAPTDAGALQTLRARFQGQFKALGAKKPTGAPPSPGGAAARPAGPAVPAAPSPAAPARPTPAAPQAARPVPPAPTAVPAAPAPAPDPASTVPAEPSIGDVFDEAQAAAGAGSGFPWEGVK